MLPELAHGAFQQERLASIPLIAIYRPGVGERRHRGELGV